MIDNIKHLYQTVKDKKTVREAVAEKCNISPLSVEKNWFSGHWSIPEKHQADVVEVLQNQVRKEIKQAQKTLEDIDVIGHIELKDTGRGNP